jgi:hypothetical protein
VGVPCLGGQFRVFAADSFDLCPLLRKLAFHLVVEEAEAGEAPAEEAEAEEDEG